MNCHLLACSFWGESRTHFTLSVSLPLQTEITEFSALGCHKLLCLNNSRVLCSLKTEVLVLDVVFEVPRVYWFCSTVTVVQCRYYKQPEYVLQAAIWFAWPGGNVDRKFRRRAYVLSQAWIQNKDNKKKKECDSNIRKHSFHIFHMLC